MPARMNTYISFILKINMRASRNKSHTLIWPNYLVDLLKLNLKQKMSGTISNEFYNLENRNPNQAM